MVAGIPDMHIRIQIKSFLSVYEVKTTKNDQVGWWGYMGRVTWM